MMEIKMKRVVCLFWLVSAVFVLASCQSQIENGIRKGLTRQKIEMLTDDRIHVVMVGTGGPMNNAKRLPSSTAIIAGGEFILVDVGPGTWRNADLFGLPLGNLSGVFLTHFHSDHIGDLGEANFGSWAAGRQKGLEVYGPEGVEKVVQGFTLAYELDGHYRIAHHGGAVMPPEASKPVARLIPIQDPNEAELFFERNGLKAYAFLVDHSPANPSVGYRFEYKGNVVVITGDTKQIPTLARHAKDADILVSEALSVKLTNLIHRVLLENNRMRLAKIMKDIEGYHMSPVQAAEVARDAKAKKLVLYHITPPVTNFIVKRVFMEGISDVYKGKVVLGEDGMIFDLDPKK
jgi:ribonuclease Z